MNTQNKNYCLFFNQRHLCTLCQLNSAAQCGLCPHCLDDLPWLTHGCEQCALPLQEPLNISALCVECFQRSPPFDRIVAALEYAFPVDQLIHSAKFNHQSYHLPLLSALLLRSVNHSMSDQRMPDIVIPVPMATDRLLQRQYNHSALLARQVARALQLDYSHRLLFKTGMSAQQSGLDRKSRQRNLLGTFSCQTAPPPFVAVVDDVVTTGATAIEIARTLKQAGAERVEIWSVARTGKQSYL